MNKKTFDRCSIASLLEGENDPRGRIFLTSEQPVDLSKVRIVHSGVDTVRQLYKGTPDSALIAEISGYYLKGFNSIMTFCGREWVVGSGGKSGYRYRLQNNEYGLILLIGSRYAELEKEGAHLKIECSPYFLKDRAPKDVQKILDEIASLLLQAPTPTGSAVHIAIDVQGWQPPKDFETRLTTRSKRRMDHIGLDSVELSGGETIQRYGQNESYLFGLPISVQFSVYRKDLEALKRDKLDWWESVWNQCGQELCEPYYNPDKPVWRLEWRFHHNTIAQIQREQGKGFTTYADLAPVLTNILHYGMDLFRLDYNTTHVDPFWQLLHEDVQVLGECDTFVVRRIYKTPARGNERNLAMAFGNMISLYARYGYNARTVIKHLKGSGLWKELCIYWGQRNRDPQAVVAKALALRRYAGKAAA